MQLKFQQSTVKPTTGLQGQKCRPCFLYLGHLSLATSSIALMFYALVWEAGNIVDLPTKRIGFFNFCLWDQKAAELDCLDLVGLEKMGVSIALLMLARVCVYNTPVLCLFAATTILQALCFRDRDDWKLACILLAVGCLILPFGIALFLFHTRWWIQVSELSDVSAALLGAHILLLVHIIFIVLYLTRFKDPPPKGKFVLAKSLA